MNYINKLTSYTYSLTLLICLMMLPHSSRAQNVDFTLAPNSQQELSASVRRAIDDKLTAILGKTIQLTGGNDGIFEITSKLQMGKVYSSGDGEGDVSNGHAQLMLFMKNRVDGSVYHTMTLNLHGNVIGNEAALQKDMISRLNASDPAFSNFGKVGRQRIKDYYAKNCNTIMTKADALYAKEAYDMCIKYLNVVPQDVECYDQVTFLIDMCVKAMQINK